MSCDCDQVSCGAAPAIAAGLDTLPRAPGLFPDWRRALLAAIGRESALAAWRAREPGDLGVMLLEMSAYVLDVASFYDQLVADESYLATAKLAGARRRLVALLGYVPRPATGAAVWLAAEVDGTRLVTLPAGTAIRSGEFDGNPPQVFELEAAATIEPRVNRLAVSRVAETLLPSPLEGLDARAGSVRVQAGDLLVLEAGGALLPARAAGVTPLALRSRDAVTRIAFTTALAPPAGASYAGARLWKGGASCGAWKLTPAADDATPVLDGAGLSLDARLNLHAGDILAFDDGSVTFASRIAEVTEAAYTVVAPLTSTLKDASNNESTFTSPAVKVHVTHVTLEEALPYTAAAIPALTVRYALADAAILHPPLKDTLAQGDRIALPGFIDAPRVAVTSLLLEDVHGEGLATTGTLDALAQCANADAAPAWERELWAPVQLYGNVVAATRGESVHGELLGTGDATLERQSFRLKKKPLTYLAAANAAGRRTTLAVHVGGIAWREVGSFYGAGEADTVYVVHHDDDGNTDVEFGGGARLPSGASVVADYRFGAGAAVPPADSIKQITRPVAGLRRIRNVLPAYGGADAESAAELALRAPQSALLIGRAISLPDFETAAASQPGVRAARAAWRWDGTGLRPAVIVSYIGDAQLAPAIQAALRALAEDDAPISVQSAAAQPARLDVDIEIDATRVPDDVVAAVAAALFAPVTLPGSGGLLRAARLGPDGIVFQSTVVRAVMDVPGVTALRTLACDGSTFVETGRVPTAGAYFDFETGGVWINGTRAP